MDEEVYDFGLRLKQLRIGKRLTQKQLAKIIDVKPETISRYENNVLTPTLETAIKLAVNLSTSLDYLVGIDNTFTLRLSGLSKKQIAAITTFIRDFTSNA